MFISIEFFGVQRTITNTDRINMPITEQTVVRDALEFAKCQFPDLLLEEETLLTTVNQNVAPPDQLLKADDTVCFLPGIGGG
jgi:molybdopterin converting factor small subunit